MSACISREGEYSDHEPGDYCPRCGAFNEEAILGERDALRAEIERFRAVLGKHQPMKVWESDRSYTLVCRECTLHSWPCPTAAAAEAARQAGGASDG